MSSGQQPPPPRRVTNVGSLVLTPQENESLFSFLGKKSVKRRDLPNGPNLPMATVDTKNPEITTNRCDGPPVNNISHTKEKEKEKSKRVTKADIGTPSNFQHIGRVGWDPDTGFDLNNLDPVLKSLFDMCGISEAQLKDRETSKVIYDFIEKTGGVEAVKNELRRQAVHSLPNKIQLPWTCIQTDVIQ
ncbi:neural Wiskott-Aldrich syndrome protein-like [Phyllostomus hastatus]|uniref:neural Wiskott-Aldrich syndrome protein-like n=1 Tax=Phyllostomus hastatus TaxID=9423 RepID=UPI001E68050C|nr:neural Wiskott-Aldrich syndrome protein-like [Phyllostomus hastatus]